MSFVNWFLVLVACLCAYNGYKMYKNRGSGGVKGKGKKKVVVPSWPSERRLLEQENESLLAALLAYEADMEPLTRDMIKLFGGPEFRFNFSMWESRIRNGEVCMIVPEDNHYRHRFDILAATGAVQQGEDVSDERCYGALTVKEIRAAIKELGSEEKFQAKKDGARIVARLDGASEWLNKHYNRDDFFFLHQLDLDVAAVWKAYMKYEAKAERKIDKALDQEFDRRY